MKSPLLMSRLEATRPPTLTWAPGANITPDGLTRKTWPLALSEPKMDEAPLPMTRFSATDAAPGCTNCMDWPAPMLKLCQLSTALSLAWLTTMALAEGVLTLAWPATTCAPSGNAAAQGE